MSPRGTISEAAREFERNYESRYRGIRQAARSAAEELSLFRSAASTAAELDAEVARIAEEKLHPHGCDLVVCRKEEGVTRFLIRVRSTGKEYDLIKSFFHSDNGLNLQTEA
jgi:transposase-like protein